MVLAAALRLSTLDVQSFWYDEAYVPVHTLHASLGATLESVVKSENTPPLWYVLVWGWSRVFGTGEVALRLPSALAGIATVAVAWGIGHELAGRRAAIATAALVATNPLLVWYSQEARAYGLFVALDGARDVVLAARRQQPDSGTPDGVRGERRGGAGDPLLRGVPARADVPVAAAPTASAGR